jgi:hypothetical protein
MTEAEVEASQDQPRRRSLLPALGVALVLALPATLHAQTIRGVVLEDDSTVPIAGATVELLRADSTPHRSAVSDARGWFELDAGSAGSYLLRPSHPSHSSWTGPGLDSVTVGAHEIVTVVLRMGRTVIPLEPLIVAARSRDRLSGFLERAAQPGQGRFIHREFIAGRVTARPSELLRMTPGVWLVPGDGGESHAITMRGPAGRCPAALFLDGLPVPQAIGMSIDHFTAADLLEGIEIYDAHTIPPSVLGVIANDCGVVAFWSRRDAHRPFSWRQLGIGLLLGAVLVLTIR